MKTNTRCQLIIDLIDTCLAEFGTPATPPPIAVNTEPTHPRDKR